MFTPVVHAMVGGILSAGNIGRKSLRVGDVPRKLRSAAL
jgi:hypothetical protein